MSKKKQKKSGNKKDQPASTINLITAIVNLVIAILLHDRKADKVTGRGRNPPCLDKYNTKNA